MRKTKFVVAIAASVGLAAASLVGATSASAAGGSNTGSGGVTGPTHIAAKTDTTQALKIFSQPTAKYKNNTCVMDISGLADFTPVSSITDCGTTVTLSSTFDKRSVPGSWATWGSPPDTEGATPHILYSAGATSVVVDLGNRTKFAGFEAEPNPFAIHSFTATYHKGNNGAGKVRGTITRTDVDGNAGAKLFGGKHRRGFKSIVFNSNDGVDFAIGQIRV